MHLTVAIVMNLLIKWMLEELKEAMRMLRITKAGSKPAL